MAYCHGKTKATVKYTVNKQNRVFVASQNFLPIDVIVTDGQKEITQNFIKSFNGDVLTTYSFTVNAPSELPEDKTPEIYLMSGTWDDCGSIGSFNSPCTYGQIYTYSGSPLLIGRGLSINGTVKNLLRHYCYVNLLLKWLVGTQVLKIFDQSGNLIFSDSGENITFNVICNDDCPPNHIKCNCPQYPGFCCIPCSEIKNGITAATAAVRKINRS